MKASFGSSADKLPPAFVQQTIERYAAFVALDQALAVQPTEEELQKQYDEHPDEYQRACLRHILVQTEAEANTVLADLRGGADFATEAAQHSDDERARRTAAISAACPWAASPTTSRRPSGTHRSAS